MTTPPTEDRDWRDDFVKRFCSFQDFPVNIIENGQEFLSLVTKNADDVMDFISQVEAAAEARGERKGESRVLQIVAEGVDRGDDCDEIWATLKPLI